MESLYNVMGKIGNGARLSHIDALGVIQRFAHSPDRAWAGLQSRSATLTELQRTDAWQALPESVTRHPRVLPIGVPTGLSMHCHLTTKG